MTTNEIETVVIGAGQCGLAAGHHLKRRDRDFVILDAHARIGDTWRRHWDSLRLYTPACYDTLPGLPFPGMAAFDFPTGRQMGDYLEAYASAQELPVMTDVAVEGVGRLPDGRYAVTAGQQRWIADNVILAVGGQQVPSTPPWAVDLDGAITQMHSDDYQRPGQLQPGPVLVVGASHSGADVALEAAQAGHDVILSGRRHGELPFDIHSRIRRLILPVMVFMWRHVLTLATPFGRRMAHEVRTQGGPLIRVKAKHLSAAGVELTDARTVGVRDGRPVLDDGRVVDVTNVVWCTGFGIDFSWVDVPVFDEDGYPRQECGVIDEAPGLYVLGLMFQRSFSSMVVAGADRDAKSVVTHLVRRMGRIAKAPAPSLAA